MLTTSISDEFKVGHVQVKLVKANGLLDFEKQETYLLEMTDDGIDPENYPIQL